MDEFPSGSVQASESSAVSRDLSARAARLAERLADFVEGHASEEAGAGGTVDFLRRWARAAIEAAGDPGARTPRGDEPGHLPMDRLISRLALTDVERDLLLLAGLPEEHEALADTFRRMHPRGEPYPSVGLAAHTIGGGGDRIALRRLLHEGAAVRTGALRVLPEGPFFERGVTLAPQLWDALHGHDAWPDALERVDVGASPAGLEGWLGLREVQRVVVALRSTEPRTLLVTADDEAVALSRCAVLARAADAVLVAGRARPDAADQIGLLTLQAAARGGVPVLLVPSPAGGEGAATLDLSRVVGPVLVCGAPGALRPGPSRPVLPVPQGRIEVADRRAAWRAALPEASAHAPQLAARHPLDPALTAQVALDVRSRPRLTGEAEGSSAPEPADVSAAIRARAGAALPAGVELVRPEAGWARLVLEPLADAQVRGAVARLEHQSLVLDDWGMREAARADRGIRLLFTGPPGTGKSLAAEVLARAAGTDLLVVDVSRVVSKWIGETEKNLAAAFDVAERTQAVLFLDEADALFGARTEISDAHDRYANLETAYLLQRLDHFDGLAVLATNLHQNIDPAFLRRMDFVVEFPMPDEGSRGRLWDLHVPQRLRADDVDLQLLAQLYPVPGAWIRNASIGAAFLAARIGGAIRQADLVAAVEQEYGKARRPLPGRPADRVSGPRDLRAARAIDAAAAQRRRQEETA
ncbi:MAG: hypothetical protein JWL64_2363 [Frankiales bacterium]|nr:hypothetical protein [Frankiales bacterium]